MKSPDVDGDAPEPRLFVTAQDGLKLHVRDYGSRASAALPVLCLPGLARSGEDFHPLALALSRDPDRPRRVVALDYRGRGRSDYDRNPANYSFPVELGDIIAVLTALELAPCVVIGTSRGGILAMLLAAVQPTALAGVVLNDIGPVIEPKGLMRIKSTIGKLPRPRTYEEGADILRRLNGAHFPVFTPEDWLDFARRTWKRDGKRLVPDYDPKLARTLDGIDFERRLPPLWDQFDALAHVPVMAIRGALSDVLSAETLAAMRERRHDVDVLEVAGQGHAPALADTESHRRIASFLELCQTTVIG